MTFHYAFVIYVQRMHFHQSPSLFPIANMCSNDSTQRHTVSQTAIVDVDFVCVSVSVFLSNLTLSLSPPIFLFLHIRFDTEPKHRPLAVVAVWQNGRRMCPVTSIYILISLSARRACIVTYLLLFRLPFLAPRKSPVCRNTKAYFDCLKRKLIKFVRKLTFHFASYCLNIFFGPKQ